MDFAHMEDIFPCFQMSSCESSIQDFKQPIWDLALYLGLILDTITLLLQATDSTSGCLSMPLCFLTIIPIASKGYKCLILWLNLILALKQNKYKIWEMYLYG